MAAPPDIVQFPSQKWVLSFPKSFYLPKMGFVFPKMFPKTD